MRDTTKFQPFFVQAKSCISDAYDLLEHKVLGQGKIPLLFSNKTTTSKFISTCTKFCASTECCAHRLALVMLL
jgi:hypothetical protein